MTHVERAANMSVPLEGKPHDPRVAALEAQLKVASMEIAELRASDGLKTQFLANISHDLRTPLTAVITHAEILRDGILGDLTPRQMESVRGIISGGRQLLNQVGEILTYARGAANQLAQRVAAKEKTVVAVARSCGGPASDQRRSREDRARRRQPARQRDRFHG